jgi:hypothetical protein
VVRSVVEGGRRCLIRGDSSKQRAPRDARSSNLFGKEYVFRKEDVINIIENIGDKICQDGL